MKYNTDDIILTGRAVVDNIANEVASAEQIKDSDWGDNGEFQNIINSTLKESISKTDTIVSGGVITNIVSPFTDSEDKSGIQTTFSRITDTVGEVKTLVIPNATALQGGAMSAADKLLLTNLDTKRYTLPSLTLAEIDTCGQETVTALIEGVKNNTVPVTYYISDLGAVMNMTVDSMSHLIYQTIQGVFTFKDGTISADSHTDGLYTTVRRMYLADPKTLPSYLGYTSSDTGKWTKWNAVSNGGVYKDVTSYNTIKSMYGDPVYANIYEEDGKLYFQIMMTGGTQTNSVSTAITEASSTSNGLMSIADKTKLDNLPESGFEFEEDQDLVTPSISTVWTACKTDGTSATNPGTVVETSSSTNFTVEKGAHVLQASQFRWIHNDDYKDPTSMEGSFGNTLSESGKVLTYTTYVQTEDGSGNTVSQTIRAPKKGLIVVNNKVKKATGSDSATVSSKLSIAWRVYAGVIESNSVTADTVTALTSVLQTSKSYTANNIQTTDSIPYFIYAYPAEFGDLTSIKKDGVESVLTAFTKGTISITNKYGYTQTYNYYITTNPNALPQSSSLTFA